MPGIVGFVDIHESEESQSLLQRMAMALHNEAGFDTDLYYAPGLGLGRVSLKITNPESQPIWNEDHTICIVMEGEIFDYERQKQELISQGHNFCVGNDPEFILHLYEHYGQGFAERLNGAFIVAILDENEKKLIIANDRIGLHPLYYFCHKGKLLFASGVRSILVDKDVPRSVDLVAIAELLTFDHVLGDRTLLNVIKLLPPASVLVYQKGTMSIRQYWELRYPDTYQPVEEESAIEQFNYLFRQAVRRQTLKGGSQGVLLSGGLDSRFLLGEIGAVTDPSMLHSFTFGIPGCDDARFAKEASEKVAVRHHFYQLPPDYLLNFAEIGVRLTDGLENCVHMHTLPALAQQVDHAQVIYKGFMGDALMGFGLSRQYWANYTDPTRYEVHFKVHTDQGLVLFHPHEYSRLLTEDFLKQIGGSVWSAYRAALDESEAQQIADQRNYFDIRQRVPRMTINGVQLVRGKAIVRLPYCDNDLIDFSVNLPPGYRVERYLMTKAFVRAFPELAKVPYAGTGYPLVHCRREILMRINTQTRWRLRSAGLNWVPAPKKRPYADYNLWMRTALRDWVIDILLDTRSLERGYFRPEYIRKLVDDHMAGENHAEKLGALITLEMWHRMFID